jgi:hypothetical protein
MVTAAVPLGLGTYIPPGARERLLAHLLVEDVGFGWAGVRLLASERRQAVGGVPLPRREVRDHVLQRPAVWSDRGGIHVCDV